MRKKRREAMLKSMKDIRLEGCIFSAGTHIALEHFIL